MVCERKMSIEDRFKIETEDIIKDYTAYKLRRTGFSNSWGHVTDRPTPAMRTMRTLGQQFEDAYNAAFEDMTRNINVNGPDAEDAIINVSDVLFSSGIQWGRLIGLIVFAAKLSVKAMQADVPEQVDNIVLWTTNHLRTPKFREWIIHHGSWAGFVEFYERPENRNGHQADEFSWTKACSLGIATIAGAAAALHLFVQKS